MTDLGVGACVKDVVFQSAHPEFFITHPDVSTAAERIGGRGRWRAGA